MRKLDNERIAKAGYCHNVLVLTNNYVCDDLLQWMMSIGCALYYTEDILNCIIYPLSHVDVVFVE